MIPTRVTARTPVIRLLKSCNFGQRRNTLSQRLISTTVAANRSSSNFDSKDINEIIKPVPIKPFENRYENVGEELCGTLEKSELIKLLNKFYRRPNLKTLAKEQGLDSNLLHQAYVSFRRYCVESSSLPVDLHIVLSDILQGSGHVDDIFPYFLRHAKTMFPHIDCLEDLRKISDLRTPASWYPDARRLQRKIIYHSGPTNSGKTYHALEKFLSAKTGIYCGPLRLLAAEVFEKANQAGTPCDLITGEERRLVNPDGLSSNHVACTVEMSSTSTSYEVGVIDEIQMMRDSCRGWAWTRALLGLCTEELHICGEGSAIDLVERLALETGDELEVRKYKRLTSLTVLNKAVENFDNVRDGDCIVCFSKADIYHASRQLEKRGRSCAVIYGTLPPRAKLAQAAMFNDPADKTKVMVATDAVGMGLNLNIKRVVFYSLMKPIINEKGEKEMDIIPPHTALQIAGRAGRFNTTWPDGEVTTFKGSDLHLLRKLLKTTVEPVELAGLHPTAEQIELFAYHLPKATLTNLIDIFMTLSTVDNRNYFLCNLEDFKFLANMIEHVPLALKTRYALCCAPINRKQPFVCTMFLKLARQISRGEPLTHDWVWRQLGWPLQMPTNVTDLMHLEAVHDVLDLYLWLTYRFIDLFPDADHIRDMQNELDDVIQTGVKNLTQLLKNAETSSSFNKNILEDEDFDVTSKKMRRKRLQSIMTDQEDVKNSLTDAFSRASSNRMNDPRLVNFSKGPPSVKLNEGQSMADILVERGVLSRDMLSKLKDEILEEKDHRGRKGRWRRK
ncbi:DgyrCDS2795 [Dimorphilus gyrociliatus]|uniref:RNA helicase n=1 Tax=Dimorphilus gyrociliatus TaxID=2664684 RepID=A0A7I8VD38_9ANNE|nr:DgyrCDS2795 [Dimorphilus gyrociliatus]